MLFQYFPQGLRCNKRETQAVLSIEIGASSKRFQTFIEYSKDTALLFEMYFPLLQCYYNGLLHNPRPAHGLCSFLIRFA